MEHGTYQLTGQRRLIYFRPPMELKLYSREWCSWCIDAKDYLSEKGYCFQETRRPRRARRSSNFAQAWALAA